MFFIFTVVVGKRSSQLVFLLNTFFFLGNKDSGRGSEFTAECIYMKHINVFLLDIIR